MKRCRARSCRHTDPIMVVEQDRPHHQKLASSNSRQTLNRNPKKKWNLARPRYNNNRIQWRISRSFFSQSPHCAANRLQHVLSSGPGAIVCKFTCNTSSAYHVQHVVLRATWYEGTAQLLSLLEFKSHLFLALFYWPNH